MHYKVFKKNMNASNFSFLPGSISCNFPSNVSLENEDVFMVSNTNPDASIKVILQQLVAVVPTDTLYCPRSRVFYGLEIYLESNDEQNQGII